MYLNILEDIEQHPIIESLDDSVTEDELIDKALKNTKLGKSSGPDGVLPCARRRSFEASLLALFTDVWTTENIPSDLVDPSITILFKKGDRSQCGNYRGISLLSAVGKLLADIISQRLQRLAENIYPQSQSSYRRGRNTIDGIFTLRQLMEKSKEQRRNLCIAFVDFTKAFDTVNRELLFIILSKLGCPAKFDSHDLSTDTKVKVYNQCLMPLLLYGSETWTLYHHQVRQLRTIQQRHLRVIMKIKWDHYVSDEEVLSQADVEDIELKLVRNRLRWLDHASRMDNDRPVKAFLYSELVNGTRPVGRPKLRYKDTCKKVAVFLTSGEIL